MDSVTVAELKAKLSHYLREVRAGESFTVLSRDAPVAVLGPYRPGGEDDFEIIPADPNAMPLSQSLLGPTPGVPDGADLIRRDREASDASLLAVFREAAPGKKRGSGEEEP